MTINYSYPLWMQEDLKQSGIPFDIANRLGFKPVNNGYIIPYRFPDSGKDIFGDNKAPFYRIKNKPGTGIKYHQPPASGIRPYVIPEAWEYYYLNPKATVYITEGEKKAIAASINGFPVISFGGIWNWGDKNAKGYGKRLHWSIGNLLNGHHNVIMIYDSDGKDKPLFKQCAQSLARALIPLNIRLYKAFVPAISGREKTGLDDWMTANNFNTIEIKEYIDMNKIEVKSTDPWEIPDQQEIRKQLQLSVTDYKLLYVITFCERQQGKNKGWCESSKQYIADAVGISKRHLHRRFKEPPIAKLLLHKTNNSKLIKTSCTFKTNLAPCTEIDSIQAMETVTFENVIISPRNSILQAQTISSNSDTPSQCHTINVMEKEKNIIYNTDNDINKDLFIKFPNLATSDKRFIPTFKLSTEETDSLVLMLKLGSMTQAALYDSLDKNHKNNCPYCNMSWATEFLFCPNCYFNLMKIHRTSIAA